MYVGIGQLVARGSEADFFEERATPEGLRYKAAKPSMTTYLKGAMVGWQVRDKSSRPGAEIATLTPYNESTGPRDPGDGFRWVEERWLRGFGIIMIPPPEWVPGGQVDLMRMTTGTTTIIATNALAELEAHAAIGQDGFVLYDPKTGWSRTGEGPQAVGARSWAPYAMLFAAVAIGTGAVLGLRR